MDRNDPCKTALLILITSRGVTDLYPSQGNNVEHARTVYHAACKLSINYYVVSRIDKYRIIPMEYRTRARDASRSFQS